MGGGARGVGNLLAIVLGLTTPRQSARIMETFEVHWRDLVGDMPMKLCFPAVEGKDWYVLTGADPVNLPWRYQNGGHWPILLWAFVAARSRLPWEGWAEFYDGRYGRYVGRHANLNQTWSAAGFLLALRLLEDPDLLAMLPGQPPPSREGDAP
ncbi:glycoside hydrolase 100 family protein [Thiohalorhabdus methylotrophus]|uniref:Glycoside hydrolase 100 family protein n=1 Tax=Thiohalorhabdus methylotrophus TaxID=3242694 RepID=A0ABV4TRJ8_9GAMM